MNRPEKRDDYRHFPEAYSNLLFEFQRAGTYTLGPMSITAANSTRRDLYRFFGFLRLDYATDEFARSLSDIARDVVVRVERETDAIAHIVLVMNPVVLAMKERADETA